MNIGVRLVYVATSYPWEMVHVASRSGMVVGGGFSGYPKMLLCCQMRFGFIIFALVLGKDVGAHSSEDF